MKTANGFGSVFFEERGAVAVIVAILAVVLIGFAAFAVDLPNLMVAKNELQNAADAGALAGARFLYDGQMVNTGADAIASDAAMANFSQKSAVEVKSVERGHWSFGLGSLPKGFTANSGTTLIDLTGKTTEELDGDSTFINAMRVQVQRSETQVPSFFARIFGHTGFVSEAEATAYVGFAGSFEPWDFDQPIAICREKITDESGAYLCNYGRMLNSGSTTSNTAGWTNFTQDPCDTASANTVRPIIQTACGADGANEEEISLGAGMGATGGTVQSVLDELYNCWMNGATNTDSDGNVTPIDSDSDNIPDQPWKLRLPVIECPANNVGNCPKVRGGVVVEVVWLQPKQIPDSKLDDPDPDVAPCEDIPCKMGGWENDDPVARNRWNDFVTTFNLQDQDGNPPDPTSKAIYFKPSCDAQEPKGSTGGENYGILAERPVLVH